MSSRYITQADLDAAIKQKDAQIDALIVEIQEIRAMLELYMGKADFWIVDEGVTALLSAIRKRIEAAISRYHKQHSSQRWGTTLQDRITHPQKQLVWAGRNKLSRGHDRKIHHKISKKSSKKVLHRDGFLRVFCDVEIELDFNFL